jgi:hypothetical protein
LAAGALAQDPRFIEKRLAEENAPVFEVQLVDREAYRAMLSFGGTVAGLAGKGVNGLRRQRQHLR